MGEKRNAYRILVRNPEGKRPLARLRRRWLDNIKIDLREIGWDVNPSGGGVEYLHRDPASRKRRRNGAKKGHAIA
jgi:hypothetical protein